MPMKYFTRIDKEDLYACTCTKFNKLMSYVNLLFYFKYLNQISEMTDGLENEIQCKIIKYAYSIGLIEKIDKEFNNVDYIKMIIFDARNRLKSMYKLEYPK